MWIEQRPKEGDTVKVDFAEWTNLGTQIGVCVGFCNHGVKILFTDMIRVIDSNSQFFIYDGKWWNLKDAF